jgi:alcohol dehydrogenase (cytochrome c)
LATAWSAPATDGWPMYNGSYAGNRFSALNQLTTKNVSLLQRVGRLELPETTSFQSGPLVVGDMMVVTTATGTYALDARTGALRWSNTYAPKSMGLGTPVRGAAYADGRIYRGTPDAHLVALDASTGKIIWDVVAANAAKGEYFGAAPIVWQGRIYIGSAGSDIGGVGHMMAFDVKDGAKAWNFDVVPSTGPGADTWPADPAKKRAGGGMYSSLALDTKTGMLYIPTGNPGPDFASAYRKGANLYTSSVVKLDAKTGEMKAYYQVESHDFHDWDVAASPILFTAKSGHARVAVAGKNGFLYVLDRDLKSLDYKVAVTTVDNNDAPLTAEGTLFSPGTQGGVNWNGPAYSPQTNALYVNAIDWPTLVKLAPAESVQHEAGKPFLGSLNEFGFSDPKVKSGWLTAIDAATGKVRWKYHSTQPMVAAVTPTAGGLLFTGDFNGDLLAFDAATGKILFKAQTGGPIGGGVVTYAVEGRQYVAVAAGMKNAIMGTESGPASVVIYALPKN